MSFPYIPALLRRVMAGAAAVPWRTRAFWATQLLVLAVVGIHFADDVYGSDLAHVPAVATLVLAVVPVGYAAIKFGLCGSLPTAMWAVALMLPDLLFLDTGLERWTHGSMLALVVIVGVAAGRLVDVQRSSTSRLFASERFRGIARVADQLPDGVCLTDLDGVITYANPAWAALQGLASPQMAVGRTLASLHPDQHADPGSVPFEQPLGGGGQLRSLVEHHRAGGNRYWADVTVRVLLDEQGQAIGRLGTVRDVTAERAAAAALQEAQERFRVTFERAPLGMALTTPEGRFLQVNDALCRMVGRSADEVLALGVLGITHPEDRELTQQMFRKGGTRERFVKRYLHADGHLVSVQITVSLVRDPAGKPLYFVSQSQDVTTELAAAAMLQEAEERFRLTFERAPLGVALVTPEGGFLQVNDALCRMVGRSATEVLALGFFGLTHPDDRELTRQLLGQGDLPERFVKRYLHADGHLVSVQITATLVRDHAGKPLYFVSQFQDVTEEERSQLQLIQQAFHDPLTGLPNRVLFEDRVGQALARERRQHGLLAIMFCDLDDFKGVNDRFGHQAGDEVLCSVAAALQGCVREADTVARLGGDEFVFLLDGVGEPAEATATAARVHAALGQPHSLAGQEVVVGASIGIAITSGETTSLETLLGEADTAMYQAKADGGGCFRVFSQLAEPAGYEPGPSPPSVREP
ncbi:MAG TPA: PAS domain S-box protein [Candidatus Nanopelagicaceae bacterium]|nr:PAS domain S-box protein [Candidatus Nanopelagicaceae bacterium]HVC22898.1 PAS domain S-box protein [Candidatus Dormibacteraeota bacterium]